MKIRRIQVWRKNAESDHSSSSYDIGLIQKYAELTESNIRYVDSSDAELALGPDAGHDGLDQSLAGTR